MSRMLRITKREVLAQIPTDSQRHLGVNYILAKLELDAKDVRSEDLYQLKVSVSSLRTKRNSRFNAASRKMDKFESKNSEWLDSEFHIPNLLLKNDMENSASTSRPGRHSLEFKKKSDRSQRREAAIISAQNEHDSSKILMACCHAARKSGEKDLHAVLKDINKTPDRPSKIRKLLDTPTPMIKKKSSFEAHIFTG